MDRRRAERRLALRQMDAHHRQPGRGDDLGRGGAGAADSRKSVGLIGNAAEVLPELVGAASTPDVVTDQTSAHDPLYGYIPAGLTLEEAAPAAPARPG